jgi:hypothetical protein
MFSYLRELKMGKFEKTFLSLNIKPCYGVYENPAT